MLPSVSHLTDHLGFWLRMVSNHVSQEFASKLAEREVTAAEWSLMRTLYGREPTSPSRIADEMGMSRGAITKLADRLIAKSLVLRAARDDDGRAQTLALTAGGEALVPELAELADRNDAEFFACLSPEERQTLDHLLKSLVARRRMRAIPLE